MQEAEQFDYDMTHQTAYIKPDLPLRMHSMHRNIIERHKIQIAHNIKAGMV